MELSTLKALGLSVEELEQKIVDKAVDELMRTVDIDGFTDSSPVANKIKLKIKEFIDAKVTAIAEEHILPNVTNLIETIVLQTTNQWGEKQGAAVTFIEYMTQRAEAYIKEQVNYEGKGKGDSNSYGWSGTQTRITYLIHQHLHYTIENAIKSMLTGANKELAAALAETCKIKLADITAKLDVNVKTK